MIFESDYARAQYVDKVGKISFPHRVIYNGLYDEEFEPVTTESAEFDFVFLGELRTLKGPFVLLEAIKRLRVSGRRCRVLMAGIGPEEDALRERIESEELGDAVVLSAPIHPARAAFAQARCVVAPSLNESMPYLILEALAAQVPLITTAVGGIPEVFGDSAQRLLPPGDAGALAQSMERFLDAPEEHRQAAAKLHAHLRNHLTVEQMDREILEFYETLIKPRRGAIAGTEVSSQAERNTPVRGVKRLLPRD
jgi:glycosyltransferase involved in cell wall biosynthesis